MSLPKKKKCEDILWNTDVCIAKDDMEALMVF